MNLEQRTRQMDQVHKLEGLLAYANLSSCARTASAAGVTLVAEAQVERTMPLADVELVAVLANLLENAIHAASSGRVAVKLRQRAFGLGITVTNPVPVG